MNTTTRSRTSAVVAVTSLIALSAMLSACEQVIASANAAPTEASAPIVANAAVYFGVEYAAAQAQLSADTAPASPTF